MNTINNRTRILMIIMTAILFITALPFVFNHHSPSASDSIALPEQFVTTSYNDDGSISLAQYNSGKGESIEDIYSMLQQVRGAYNYKDASTELIYNESFDYHNGISYSFLQYHNGIAVYGRGIKVIAHDGGGYTITSNYLANITARHDSRKTAEYMTNKAKADWGKLIYYPNNNGVTAAYLISISGETFIIDGNARVLEQINNIREYSYNRTEREQLNYHGNSVLLPLEQSTATGTYYLQDGIRNIYMVDAGGIENYNSTSIINSTSGDIDNKRAVSAMENAIITYDYYTIDNVGVNHYGVKGKNDNVPGNASTNKENTLHIYVNYGNQYANAAYVSNGLGRDKMVLGNGSNSLTSPLYETARSLEIMAHEYQHGVTNSLAGLNYVGESGALSEALSDIFAALVSGQDISKFDFWLIAEDAMTPYRKALRNMANPMEYGDPMDYNSRYVCNKIHYHDNTCDYSGVHGNSGIINYTFYKMWKGDEQTMTTSTLGTLIFNSLHKLNSTSTFKQFYQALMSTAAELKLSPSSQLAITRAFAATNIIKADASLTYTQTTAWSGLVPATKLYHSGESVTITTTPGIYIDGMDLYMWQDKSAGAGEKMYYKSGETFIINRPITLSPIAVPKTWNNITPTTLDGSGTAESPYLIASASDLATVAHYINNYDFLREYGYELPDGHNSAVGGGHYKQIADIDLESLAWTPIGGIRYAANSASTRLNYDGGGYSISYLSIAGDVSYSATGLFGKVEGDFKNIHVKSGNISNSNIKTVSSGGIIGSLSSGSISQSSNNVTVSSNSTTVYSTRQHGGIVGEVNRSVVRDCYNTANITGHTSGGIAGIMIDSTLATSYNSGKVTGTLVGGLTGIASSSAVINTINIGTVAALRYGTDTSKPSLGSIIGQWYMGSAQRATLSGNSCYSTYETNGITCNIGNILAVFNPNADLTESPLLHYNDNIYYKNNYADVSSDSASKLSKHRYGSGARVSTDALYSGDFNYDDPQYYKEKQSYNIYGVPFNTNDIWLVTASMPLLKASAASSAELLGDGSVDNPYKISSAQDIVNLSILIANASYNNKHYLLTRNIYMDGIVSAPIGTSSLPFTGHFDGNGYTISDIIVHGGNEKYSGLFGVTYNATVVNLTVTGEVYGKYSGMLIGKAIGATTVRNVTVKGTVDGHVSGGLIGSLSTVNSGGLIGLMSTVSGNTTASTITEISASVRLFGSIVGGIVGECNTNVIMQGIDSSMSVISYSATGTWAYVGGLIGNVMGGDVAIYTATVKGSVEAFGTCYASGIIGALHQTNTEDTVPMAINITASTIKLNLDQIDSNTRAAAIAYIDSNADYDEITLTHSVIVNADKSLPDNAATDKVTESDNTQLMQGECKILYYVDELLLSHEVIKIGNQLTFPTLPYKEGYTPSATPWILSSSTEDILIYNAQYDIIVLDIKFICTDSLSNTTYTLIFKYNYGERIGDKLANALAETLSYRYTLSYQNSHGNDIITTDRLYYVSIVRDSHAINIYARGKIVHTITVYDGITPTLPDVADVVKGAIPTNNTWKHDGDISNVTAVYAPPYILGYELAILIMSLTLSATLAVWLVRSAIATRRRQHDQ